MGGELKQQFTGNYLLFSHAGNTGSIPVRATRKASIFTCLLFLFCMPIVHLQNNQLKMGSGFHLSPNYFITICDSEAISVKRKLLDRIGFRLH